MCPSIFLSTNISGTLRALELDLLFHNPVFGHLKIPSIFRHVSSPITSSIYLNWSKMFSIKSLTILSAIISVGVNTHAIFVRYNTQVTNPACSWSDFIPFAIGKMLSEGWVWELLVNNMLLLWSLGVQALKCYNMIEESQYEWKVWLKRVQIWRYLITFLWLPV